MFLNDVFEENIKSERTDILFFRFQFINYLIFLYISKKFFSTRPVNPHMVYCS